MRTSRLLPFLFLIMATSAFAAEQSGRLNEIQIDGLQKTKESVVLNAIQLNEGDVIDEDRIDDIVRDLENLRQFRDIEVHLEELPNNKVDLIIRLRDPWTLFGYPIPSYNSYSGFAIFVSVGDRNFLGYLDTMSLSLGFGYNPQFSDFVTGIQSYRAAVSYGFNRIPGMEQWGFYGGLSGGMYSQKSVDSTNAITHWNDQYSFNGMVSGSYKFHPDWSVSASVSISGLQNDLKITDPARTITNDVTSLGPTLSLSYGTFNYLDGGSVYYGVQSSVSESVRYDFTAERMTNFFLLSVKTAVLPFPLLNIIMQGDYKNSVNSQISVGGYSSRLRGFRSGEVLTDNALLMNLEARFTVFEDLFFGKWSVALFSDNCYSFDSFDFPNSIFHSGLGGGVRFRPNFLGGVLLKVDVAFALTDIGRSPEIMVTLGELL